jgi:CRISPR-associated protein Cas1
MLLVRGKEYGVEELKISAARIRPLVVAAEAAGGLETLRGFEGAVARLYYSVFPHLVRNPDFSFNGRSRRPPLDPVNALLSFAYTLVTNEVLSAVKSVGLDPYLGALHEEAYGRPSLACDLAEEYRCFIADRLVLGLINRRMVTPDDFVFRESPPAEFTDEEEMSRRRPVEMKPAVLRAFVASYEETMRRRILYPATGKQLTYRWLIMSQVRQFAASLENPDKAYEPFVWEG